MKKIHFLISIILVPIVNIVAATRLDLIHNNLSDLSSMQEYYWLYLTWIAFSVGSFFINYVTLIQSLHKGKILCKVLAVLSLTLFILATFIPYELIDKPKLAVMHINVTILATLFFIGIVFVAMRYLYFSHVLIVKRFIFNFSLLIIICIGIYAFFGSINSLSEIAFCIGSSYLLYHFNIQLTINGQ